MTARIAEIEKEIAAGDGSQEFWECVFFKYRWEGEVRYDKERLASQGEGYHHKRYDHELTSGNPLGSKVYVFEDRHRYVAAHGETIPSKYAAMFQLGGQDQNLFYVEYPGKVYLARPLPIGEYQFYFNHTPKRYIVCDGKPEEEKKRREHFVTVAAPPGVAHEAFFDPVAMGNAVGADASNGVLSPADFTISGKSVSLSGLKWEGSQVTLATSPHKPLTGHLLDFIALDGTVALTLDAATADSAAGTLT